MKSAVEIVVERADGKRGIARERVQEELEGELLVEGTSFYPTTDAGTEVEYVIKSVEVE